MPKFQASMSHWTVEGEPDLLEIPDDKIDGDYKQLMPGDRVSDEASVL